MTTASLAANFRNGRHVVFNLHAHLVLTPKYRRKVLTVRVTRCLQDSCLEVASRFDVQIEAFESDSDHVHLLIAYPPKLALSNLVMTMKTISSMRVREQNFPEVSQALWGEHFWSPSYCVVSAGGAPLEIIKKYIEGQRSPNRPKGRPGRTPIQKHRDSSPP
jgi:putative transposase